MKSKEDLFHLIKAMSKSEKRYFTLDAQKGGRKDSKYLELFQAINAMGQYEEQKLKKKFPKNLPSDKTYLYEAILRSMRDYRSSKSKAAQIKEMILDSKYLYERGLYQQSEERLRDGEELARQLDDQFALLEINKEKLQLSWDTKKRDYEEDIEEWIQRKEANITQVNHELTYLEVCSRLLMRVNQHYELETVEEKEQLVQQFYQAFFTDESKPVSGQALRRFYQSRALYYQLLGNYDEVFHNYSEVVNWWNSNPKFKAENFSRFIVDISNLLHAYTANRKYEFIPKLLDDLELNKPSNINDQKIIFQKVSIYRLIYHINLGVVEGADKLVNEIKKGLDFHKLSQGTRLILIFNVSVLLFILERFKECSKWASRISKEFRLGVRTKDILMGAQILNLIATFELDDLDQTDAMIRSSHRFFNIKLQSPKGSFELKVVDYIKQLELALPSAKQQIFSSFSQDVKQVNQNPKEMIPHGLDELVLYWLESRLKRQPITLVMKKDAA